MVARLPMTRIFEFQLMGNSCDEREIEVEVVL
jgi:hypothetical protein